MPALTRNCYKTPHGFIFRIVIPEVLRQVIGKREIKPSLGKDYREAVSQARLLSLQVDRQFSELQQKTNQQIERQCCTSNLNPRLVAMSAMTLKVFFR